MFKKFFVLILLISMTCGFVLQHSTKVSAFEDPMCFATPDGQCVYIDSHYRSYNNGIEWISTGVFISTTEIQHYLYAFYLNYGILYLVPSNFMIITCKLGFDTSPECKVILPYINARFDRNISHQPAIDEGIAANYVDTAMNPPGMGSCGPDCYFQSPDN